MKHGRRRGEEIGQEPETRNQVWQKAEQRSEDAAPLLLCSSAASLGSLQLFVHRDGDGRALC